MKRFAVALLVLSFAAAALAEDVPVGKFVAAKEVTAAKVAATPAASPVKVGAFHLPGNAELRWGLFCAGADATLACDARRADGAVIGKAVKFEKAAGDVAVVLERTGAGLASWKTVRLLVPGTTLRFGGQDMGDY